jgi:hypothetical protein
VRSSSSSPWAPPTHSVTSSPVSSKCTPPSQVPAFLWMSSVCSISWRMSSKSRVLMPWLGLDAVAVHRVADPEDGLAARVDALDDGELGPTFLAPMRTIRTILPGSRAGLSRSSSASTSPGSAVGPTFTPTGFAMPRKNSTCAPSSWRVRSPIHGRWVVRSYQPGAAGDPPGLGGLVDEVEPLVAREELDRLSSVDVRSPSASMNASPSGECPAHRLVLLAPLGRETRVLHERPVPVLGVVDVGEAAVEQRADEVERHRRVLVAADHQVRVGPAGVGVEVGAVDQVAEVAGQFHFDSTSAPSTPFSVGLDRGLAYCPANRPTRVTGRLQPVDEHQAHLEQDLELVRDGLGPAVIERLGAVAPLQDEPPPRLGLVTRSPRRLQALDLVARHQRGQAGSDHPVALLRVAPAFVIAGGAER